MRFEVKRLFGLLKNGSVRARKLCDGFEIQRPNWLRARAGTATT